MKRKSRQQRQLIIFAKPLALAAMLAFSATAIAADQLAPVANPIDPVTDALLSARSERCSVERIHGADNREMLTLGGSHCDGRPLINVLLDCLKEGRATASASDVDVTFRAETLTAYNDTQLHGVGFRLVTSDGQIREFALTAEIGSTAGLFAEQKLQLDGRRVLSVETNDAGALLRALDIYRRMLSGNMSLVVDVSASDQNADVDQLEVTNFSIADEWVFRELVAPRTHSGNTVGFRRLHLKFTRSSGNLSINEGMAKGPFLNATINGKIEFETSRVALRGAFLPSYLFGSDFASFDNSREGTFAMSYDITGPLKAPILHIDPWAPSDLRLFIRGLLER
jgi:hypothetical protein